MRVLVGLVIGLLLGFGAAFFCLPALGGARERRYTEIRQRARVDERSLLYLFDEIRKRQTTRHQERERSRQIDEDGLDGPRQLQHRNDRRRKLYRLCKTRR